MATRKIKIVHNNKTVPVKSQKVLRDIIHYWLNKRSQAKYKADLFRADRNWCLIFICLNTAFRIEDAIQLKPIDFAGGYMRIKENKRGKPQNYRLNSKVYSEIKDYIERNNIKEYDYLFPSTTNVGEINAITRTQGWRVIKEAFKAAGILGPCGPHSLRKTFGYHYIKRGGELLTLSKMLNHTSPLVTIMYVMWDTDDTETARNEMYLGSSGKY